MEKVRLTINGQQVETLAGKTVWEAATEAGFTIPVLCHHPALPPDGACRICVVEREPQGSLETACNFPVQEGLVLQTHSPKVIEARKAVLELLLSNHPLDCLTCEATGNCLLQDLAYEYEVKGALFAGERQQFPIDTSNPFIQVDRNKCILCRRCVRACKYINGVEAVKIIERGFNAVIAFGEDTEAGMAQSPCEFCGSCLAICPTGALTAKMSLGQGRNWEYRSVKTTCSYCGVGCQLDLKVKDNTIVRVDSSWESPANRGWMCVKGRFGYDYVSHPDRLTKPRVRKYLLEGEQTAKRFGDPWVEVDWDTALDLTANRLRGLREGEGGDRIGVLTSAKCLNEENYLMNKFARQVLGTNNIDHCARL
jgi:predicted molibdopterin-dependent oxidoreductase YjgC